MPRRARPALALAALALVAGLLAPSAAVAAQPAAAVAARTDKAPPGTTYTDPQGAYTLVTGPKWSAPQTGLMQGVEVWSVAPPRGGFSPNVNVVVTARDGGKLRDLVRGIARQGRSMFQGFGLVSAKLTKGSAGQPLARLEYRARISGRRMHLLQYTALSGDQVATVTFTAPDPRFASLRPSVEPYLRTLQGTGTATGAGASS